VRNKPGATDLQALAESAPNRNIHIIQADLKDLNSIKSAAAEVAALSGGKLDVLINNAAMMGYERSFLTLDKFPSDETLEEDMLEFFKTNVVGVTHTINAFLPMIKAGGTKKIFVISSGMGSPKYVLQFGHSATIAYGISKAALNMAVAKFSLTYKDIIFLAVSPGFVRTMQGPAEEVQARYDMINARVRANVPDWPGDISVEESVRDQLELFDKVTLEKSGRFVRRDGEDGTLGEFRS